MTDVWAPLVLPDALQVTIAYLTGRAEVTAHVGSLLPDNWDGATPTVRVLRIGGTNTNVDDTLVRDGAALDIEVWAGDQGAAWDVMAPLRAVLQLMTRAAVPVAVGAVVHDAVEDVAPQWIPDPAYAQAGRLLLQATVTVGPVN